MEWLPELKLGWSNGWLMLALFYLIFGILMFLFPRDVVVRLFSISGWNKQQRILFSIGKLFSLSCLAIIIFSPLKIGLEIFVVGSMLFVFGFIGMIVALFNYKNTAPNQPATQGLYQVSRNPQWISLATMLLGACIAIGSWVAIVLLLIAALFYHFRILGEERACLHSYGKAYQDYMKRVPRYVYFF